jgi:hypothetical protein
MMVEFLTAVGVALLGAILLLEEWPLKLYYRLRKRKKSV